MRESAMAKARTKRDPGSTHLDGLAAVMRRRAATLLKADADGPDAWTDGEIAGHLEATRTTVVRVRLRFAAEGPDGSRRWWR
jgi:hypothetical protein